MASDTATTRDGARHPSPPLVVLAVVYTAVFLASLVLTALLTAGEHFPSPFASSTSSFEFFARHSLAVRWSGFLQLGAAVPLGLFTATVASRLHFLGVRAAGATIALFGGIALDHPRRAAGHRALLVDSDSLLRGEPGGHRERRVRARRRRAGALAATGEERSGNDQPRESGEAR